MKRGIVLLLLILVACAGQEPVARPAPVMPQIEIVTPKPLPEKPEYEPPPTAPEVVQIEIEAKMFDFLPSEIKVKKGDFVRLIITSIDVPHTFTMPAYGIDEKLEVGKDVVIEFTADKAGQFGYYCDVPGHSGMKGKLIIT